MRIQFFKEPALVGGAEVSFNVGVTPEGVALEIANLKSGDRVVVFFESTESNSAGVALIGSGAVAELMKKQQTDALLGRLNGGPGALDLKGSR